MGANLYINLKTGANRSINLSCGCKTHTSRCGAHTWHCFFCENTMSSFSFIVVTLLLFPQIHRLLHLVFGRAHARGAQWRETGGQPVQSARRPYTVLGARGRRRRRFFPRSACIEQVEGARPRRCSCKTLSLPCRMSSFFMAQRSTPSRRSRRA